MCKDGKCQTRSALISLGMAARELAKLARFPQMVIRTPSHVALIASNPLLDEVPGNSVIMDVYPTTTDDDIARKADRYIIEGSRSNAVSMIKMLENIFGLPSMADGDIPAPTVA